MQIVNVQLGTPTFDEVERSERVTIEAALGLIGGSMGLFTVFFHPEWSRDCLPSCQGFYVLLAFGTKGEVLKNCEGNLSI